MSRYELTARDIEDEPFLPLLVREAGAACFRAPEFEFWELVSFGWMGLVDAREKFDARIGDFEPYAVVRVRGAIRSEVWRLRRTWMSGAPKQMRVQVDGVDAALAAAAPDRADARAVRREEAEILCAAVNRLPPHQRQTVRAYYVEDRTAREIAGGGNPKLVGSTLFKAREQLRGELLTLR